MNKPRYHHFVTLASGRFWLGFCAHEMLVKDIKDASVFTTDEPFDISYYVDPAIVISRGVLAVKEDEV